MIGETIQSKGIKTVCIVLFTKPCGNEENSIPPEFIKLIITFVLSKQFKVRTSLENQFVGKTYYSSYSS